jgi:ABC-type Fe3+ transport system permease subunit
LGAEFMGGLAFIVVAPVTYFVVSYFMRAWEKRYTRKLDEQERFEEMKGARR